MNDNSSLNLRIGHLNGQSISRHFPDILTILDTYKPHILAISESWLKPNISSKLFQIPGYKLERVDRLGKASGGVVLLIAESLDFRVLETSEQSVAYQKRPEFLFISCSVNSTKILLGVVYSPHNSGYWYQVEEAFVSCNAPYDFAIVLGDFNIDWRSNSTPRKILAEFFTTCKLSPIPFEPTHHRKDCRSSTIDYICVSDLKIVKTYEQISYPSISDHDILIAELSIPAPRSSTVIVMRRDFRRFNRDLFQKQLGKIDWERMHDCGDVDSKVHLFSSELRQLYDTHAPYSTFHRKSRPSPWLNRELKDLIRARNKAWSVYRRSRRSTDHFTYKTLRNRVKSSIRSAISNYYKQQFESSSSTTEMWRLVGDMGLTPKQTDYSKVSADLDALNSFFIGDSPLLHQPAQRSSARISPDDRFFFKHIEATEVVSIISSARSNARGVDDIPNSFLKDCLPTILPVLIHIYDCSLQSGVFPSLWKRAIVRPIPKCNPPLEPGHLRPISILCAASKVLETLACNQLSSFINEKNILNEYQSGFRKHYSTHTALVRIVDDIRIAIDRKEIVLAVAVDYSKAFDLVNISLLVDKLKEIGLSDSACNWINSYLSDRSQVVALNDNMSTPAARNAGVPQGSPLGPLFFSMFANDAPSVIRYCKFHMYADDLTLYYSGPMDSIEQILDRVNLDLANIAAWAESNCLLINSKKSQAIWFGTRTYIAQLRSSIVRKPVINDEPIGYTESIKVLGFTLDATLSWAPHCTVTIKKCYAALSRLRKCSDLLPRGVKLTLVKALVFPYFDYCASLLLSLTDELCKKMQRCKNSALRFATGLRRWEHITPAYVENDILKFNNRCAYVCISLLAKILASSAPSYLSGIFAFRDPDKSGSKRRPQLDLDIDWARTSCCQKSFSIRAAHLWNNLPAELRSLYMNHSFKKVLLNHMLDAAKRGLLV